MGEPRRVYLDKECDTYCIVDEEDYAWASKWRWSYTWDRSRTKKYATRMTRQRKVSAIQIKVYMHKEILKRSKGEPPSELHTIGDHKDGRSLNNTRNNLRYATLQQNRRNVAGCFVNQNDLDLQEELQNAA